MRTAKPRCASEVKETAVTDDIITPEEAAAHAAKKARIKAARDRMMADKQADNGK